MWWRREALALNGMAGSRTGASILFRPNPHHQFLTRDPCNNAADEDFIRSAVRTAIQAALEAEMTEARAAERSERGDGRLGYRSGSYGRSRSSKPAGWLSSRAWSVRARHIC